jgi:hypothetical protein
MYLDGRSHTPQAVLFNMTLMPILALISLGEIWKLLTAPKAERILDPQATLIVEESRMVRVFRLLAILILVLAGVWGVTIGEGPFADVRILPAIGALLIAGGIFGLATMVFNPRQRLILTPQSLFHSRLRPAAVAWEDIVGIKSKKFLATAIITLELRESREFRAASLLARWRRIERLKLNPRIFGVEPTDLLRGLELRRNVFTF